MVGPEEVDAYGVYAVCFEFLEYVRPEGGDGEACVVCGLRQKGL